MNVYNLTHSQLDAACALALGAKGVRLHTYRGEDVGPQVWVVDWERDWIELSSLDYHCNWELLGAVLETGHYDLKYLMYERPRQWAASRRVGWDSTVTTGPTAAMAVARLLVTLHGDIVLPQEPAYAALKAERDALKADAERYQFLRNDFSPMSLNIDGNHEWAYRRNATLRGSNLDAAIDATMKEKNHG